MYSKGTAWENFYFDLLWSVGHFGYQVNPHTSSYENIHEWKTAAMIDSTHAHQCKAFFTIASLDSHNIFLANSKAQKTLIDSVIQPV
ncbi:MAG: hypothetical protein R2794_06590 [Chitinophagales bacterium]